MAIPKMGMPRMGITRLSRQLKRPNGVCMKMTTVVILGICVIFVLSTYSPSSSALTSQRSSFSDIAEPVKDNHVNYNKGKTSAEEVREKEKKESYVKEKEKTKGDEHKNPKKIKKKEKKPKVEGGDLIQNEVSVNATQSDEGAEKEELQKEKDGEEETEEGKEEDVVEADGADEDKDPNALEEDESGEKTEDEDLETKNTARKKKYLGPVFDKEARYSWKMCSVRSKYNYIPCIDIESSTGKLQLYRHRERSCPKTPPMCLVPLPPKGYDSPVQWPDSKFKILYRNVEHPKLTSFIKTKPWAMQSGEYLTFPQNQSEFKGGVQHYIDSIEEMVPDIEWGKNIRLVLDVGCLDSSFGSALLEKEVLALTLGLKNDLVDLAQVALERGFAAIVSPFRARRLPFPSDVFDTIHCGSCRIPWHSNGGKLLLEMNRILRPGGYFILSTKHDNIEEEEAMSTLMASICWNVLAHKTDEISEMGVKIYQKPDSNSIYELRRKKTPPLCKEDENADSTWYVPIKTCLNVIPEAIEQHGTEWPSEWPQRLQTFPEWIINRENLLADTQHWKSIVDKSYLIGMGINWSNVRNIIDMKSTYGGFAAALVPKNVWVMNVVPVHSPDTLPVIYERGLVGMYHDWCESFPTYSRSYDLLHADHVFSRLKNRCRQPVGIVVEMDRIVRPGGWAIIREKVELLDPLEVILRSLHWEIRMTYAKDKEGIMCAQKTNWRP